MVYGAWTGLLGLAVRTSGRLMWMWLWHWGLHKTSGCLEQPNGCWLCKKSFASWTWLCLMASNTDNCWTDMRATNSGAAYGHARFIKLVSSAHAVVVYMSPRISRRCSSKPINIIRRLAVMKLVAGGGLSTFRMRVNYFLSFVFLMQVVAGSLGLVIFARLVCKSTQVLT
jgi:hypothetical protein